MQEPCNARGEYKDGGPEQITVTKRSLKSRRSPTLAHDRRHPRSCSNSRQISEAEWGLSQASAWTDGHHARQVVTGGCEAVITWWPARGSAGNPHCCYVILCARIYARRRQQPAPIGVVVFKYHGPHGAGKGPRLTKDSYVYTIKWIATVCVDV